MASPATIAHYFGTHGSVKDSVDAAFEERSRGRGSSGDKAEVSPATSEAQYPITRKYSRQNGTFQKKHQVNREWLEPLDKFALVNFNILADELRSNLSSRNQEIIGQRYESNEEESLTLEEIGRDFGLSRARVEQIIRRFRTSILWTVYGNVRGYRIDEELRMSLAKFLDAFTSVRLIPMYRLEDEMVQRSRSILSLKEQKTLLALLLDLFPHIKADIVGTNWILFQKVTKADFMLFYQSIVQHISSQVSPIALPELAEQIFSNAPKRNKFEIKLVNGIIEEALRQNMYLEMLLDGRIETRIEFLKTYSQQVERILRENGGPMHISAIREELKQRLQAAGVNNLPGKRFGSNDFRLNPHLQCIGKTGKWYFKAENSN